MMLEAVRASETSVYCNETTRRCIPEGCYLQVSKTILLLSLSALILKHESILTSKYFKPQRFSVSRDYLLVIDGYKSRPLQCEVLDMSPKFTTVGIVVASVANITVSQINCIVSEHYDTTYVIWLL
jgi:hypothetical protein